MLDEDGVNRMACKCTDRIWDFPPRRVMEILGFGENRCSNCLTPFFQSQLLDPQCSSLRLCVECQGKLGPYQGSHCVYCGLPVTPNARDWYGRLTCERCRYDPPPWDGLAFYGIYEGDLRDLVLRLKFDGEIQIARLFADFLIQACACLPVPDLVLPIPQYPANLQKRGYNQANEIGKIFAKNTKLFYSANILSRIRPGLPQEKLTAIQRQENLRGAFHCDSDLSGKTIWIIDDVLTTGSTCREATYALRGAGAKHIHALVIARTDL